MSAGQYIFQGLSNLGDTLDRLAAKRDEEQKQIKERAQRQSKLEAALDTMGVMPKEISKTRSLEELEGVLAGVQDKAKLGLETFKLKQMEQALAAQQEEAAYGQRLESALARLSPRRDAAGAALPPDRNEVYQAILNAKPPARVLQSIMENFSKGDELGAPTFYDVPGLPNQKVVTRGGYTSTVGAGTQPGRDPLDAVDYKSLSARETQLEMEVSAARGRKQLDLANQLAGQLNAVKRRKKELRGGSPPAVRGEANAGQAVPQAHADYLRAHPEKRASFEATYGKAAAAAILDN